MPATSRTTASSDDDGEQDDTVTAASNTEHPVGDAQASANTDNEPAG